MKPVIVYADDDADDREMFREYLGELYPEMEMIEVSNGREALLYLQSSTAINCPPRLLVLDLNMPVLNGRETLAILKSEEVTENLPVAVFTTSSSQEDQAFCKKFGVKMISKPRSVEEFKNSIRALVSTMPGNS